MNDQKGAAHVRAVPFDPCFLCCFEGTFSMREFSERLQKLRETQRRSRKVTSELCGLPPDAIRRYESGEAKPTVDSLIAIADYFEVSLDYLCGRVDQ